MSCFLKYFACIQKEVLKSSASNQTVSSKRIWYALRS